MVASLVSLLLCVATVVLATGSVVRSMQFGWAGWKNMSAGLWWGGGVRFNRGQILGYGFSGTWQLDNPLHLDPTSTGMQPHFVYERGLTSNSQHLFRVGDRHLGGPLFVDIRYIEIPFWVPAGLLALPVTWMIPNVRRLRAMTRTGRCRACLYNLTGNTSGTCPECGTSVSQNPKVMA